MSGRVAVVAGEGQWRSALLKAEAAGATAVVVTNPRCLPPEGAAPEGPRAVPVAVERAHSRPDDLAVAVLARGENTPTLLTIECAASAEELEPVLRDSLRWAAALSSGRLRTVCGAITARGGMALLEAMPDSGGPIPVTLGVCVLVDDARQPLLRVTALGEVRSDIESGGPDLGVRVRTTTAEGAHVARKHYEVLGRLHARRALEAAAAGVGLPDLGELLEDQRIVAELLGEHNQG